MPIPAHLTRVAHATRVFVRAQARADALLAERNEAILMALRQGASGADIARVAGMSRQRVCDLLKGRQ